MIVGYLENAKRYEKLIPVMEEIAEIVRSCDGKPCGRYETFWGFYSIQEGETIASAEGLFESHREYIDVQCLTEGTEYVEWQDIQYLDLKVEYSKENDYQLMSGSGSLVKISAGMFYVLLPEDAHKACRHVDKTMSYRKVVAKVRV